VLTRIAIDAAAEARVAAQGFEIDGVAPEGVRVKLASPATCRPAAPRSTDPGGAPDNVEIAETAARIVGLDVAGIDFICPDIATPVRETRRDRRGQRRPGFRMHTIPPRASRSTWPSRSSTCSSRGRAGPHPDPRRDRLERKTTTSG